MVRDMRKDGSEVAMLSGRWLPSHLDHSFSLTSDIGFPLTFLLPEGVLRKGKGRGTCLLTDLSRVGRARFGVRPQLILFFF
jgi:hypothetical protein